MTLLRTTFALLAAAAALAPAAAAARPPAQVVVTECVRSLDPEQRRATFEGRMDAWGGSERLQMRFVLKQRTPGERWGALPPPPGWSDWVTSEPGRAGFHYFKAVSRLAAPAAYRTVVRFRWLDAEGAVLARRRARSRPCRQPDLRPDLEVERLVVRPADEPGTRRYVFTIRNDGRRRAGASRLDVRVGGELHGAEVPPVGRWRTRRVTVLAPRCAEGAQVRALVDAGGAIDERDEADNAFSRVCAR